MGGSANNIIVALVVILLPGTIRVIRSQVLSIKELDYTLAATAIGAGSARIMLRHILPNVVASYIVLGTITLGFAIIIEASLSFLGVGVSPDIPTWGTMLTQGARDIRIAWWLAAFPGIAITVVFSPSTSLATLSATCLTPGCADDSSTWTADEIADASRGGFETCPYDSDALPRRRRQIL